MKKYRSVLCVECVEKIKEINEVVELENEGQKFRVCRLCGRRGALSEYEHWTKVKPKPAEQIMEIGCKLCHYPFIAESQEELDEQCDSCPLRAYLNKRGADV